MCLFISPSYNQSNQSTISCKYDVIVAATGKEYYLLAVVVSDWLSLFVTLFCKEC